MKTIEIIVDSRLRIAPCRELSEGLTEALRAEFTHPNPAHEQWSVLPYSIQRYKPEPPKTIETWMENAYGYFTLPRGGQGRVEGLCNKHGLLVEFADRRSHGADHLTLRERPVHNLTLFDFQEQMASAALAAETCILRAPCGSGKTSVGIAIASRVGVPTLIVVPASKIFDEWVKRLGLELGLAPDEIGWFGRGKKKIRPITVATIDTLKRHVDEIALLFGCVIFDEVHRAPATSYYPAIDSLPCKYRIGISADEQRKDRKHGINYDLFGDVAVDVSQRDLVSRGIVIAVDVRLVPTEFAAPWYVSLSSQDKRRPDLYNRLLEEMVSDAARTGLATALAVQEASARPTLVFSHRIAQCARMRADISLFRGLGGRVGVILGDEAYRAESDETVKGLQGGTYRCGVGTYQSIGTGIDLPGVESGIAVTPILANKQNFVQIRDRLCRVDRRPGATKRRATLYVLWDRKVFGDRPLRNAIAWSRGNVSVLDGSEWVDGREYLRGCDDYSLTGGGQ